jgi:hypothetical protein
MDITTNTGPQVLPAPLGNIEPHAGLLTVPQANQPLYKMMTVENLLRSVSGGYLHFNRVDSYMDFPGADSHDGQQLPSDHPGNASARFQRAPDYSAADYYDRSRSRTYACCFSLEHSDFIWRNYANGSPHGKVCVVFEYEKLRATLNRTFQTGNAALEYNGLRCHQIFSLNYGIVEYVDWDRHRANEEHLPNPIRYTYLKGTAFSQEKELRISLSALGVGNFQLNDGSFMEFPPALRVSFDFKGAISDGTISRLLSSSENHSDFLTTELHKLRIVSN